MQKSFPLMQTYLLWVLKQHQLVAKRSKCSFAHNKLEYLGHIISDQGVATDCTKTQAMMQWPIPTNVSELRGFLRLTGYYREFVKHYNMLAKPLTVLLQKKNFQWSAEAQDAFDRLKRAMSQTPMLALPDFKQPFSIEIGACDTRIGAVLTQNGHPVAYYIKALSSINQKLPIYENEFLAIMMAIEKWRSYLQRGPFVIKTDHKSLCHLEDQMLTSKLQKKAMTKLIGLQYKFQYQEGEDNKVANALSRVEHVYGMQAISITQPVWIQEVLNSYEVDSKARALLAHLAITGTNEQGYALVDGLIKHKGRIWIGSNAGLQTKLIQAFRTSPIGGYSDIHATYQRTKKMFRWKGLKHDMENFVRRCGVCQQAKHENC